MSLDSIGGIIGGMLIAFWSALLTYNFQKKWASDKEIFTNWQSAIRRSAFKGKFDWMTGGTNVEKFRENIKDLKLVLNQGIVKKQNFYYRGGGISHVKNKQWRVTANKVYDKMDEIFKIVSNEKNFYKEETAREIDKKRDEIILLFNPIWKKLKLDEFKLPSESDEIVFANEEFIEQKNENRNPK